MLMRFPKAAVKMKYLSINQLHVEKIKSLLKFETGTLSDEGTKELHNMKQTPHDIPIPAKWTTCIIAL